MKKHGVYHLSGDGRCDSPGRNTKYPTYSLMDNFTNRILAFSLTQVTEAGNSNRMEKVGFKKVLSAVKGDGIIPSQITTDRHTGIRKHQRKVYIQLPKKHLAKLLKSGSSQLGTIFGGHAQQAKAMWSCCVKSG